MLKIWFFVNFVALFCYAQVKWLVDQEILNFSVFLPLFPSLPPKFEPNFYQNCLKTMSQDPKDRLISKIARRTGKNDPVMPV